MIMTIEFLQLTFYFHFLTWNCFWITAAYLQDQLLFIIGIIRTDLILNNGKSLCHVILYEIAILS